MFLLMAGAQVSWGFALLGPSGNGEDSWQTTVIGYDLAYGDESSPSSYGGPVFLGDIGGPKNIGEGYRRNIPALYYAYDSSFLDFFGSNGVAAVDSAFAVMNSLTNVDSYSTNLSEFPLNSQSFNYQAQSLYLTDLKSVTLHALVEQMGLADPERFTWTLAERFLPSGGVCPIDEYYLVVQRNFADAPTALNQIQYSSYVNNVLYSYAIAEICTGPDPLAVAEPFATDPDAEAFTSVAANNGDISAGLQFSTGGGLQVGGYYNGLTQDDVAGLRYLLSTNRYQIEAVSPDNILINSVTNFSQEALFPVATGTNTGYLFNGVLYGTGDLGALLRFARTNDPTLVPIAFPGVQVVPVSSYITNMLITNVVTYFTNSLDSPFGTQVPVTITVVSNSLVEYYVDSFPNIITNNYSSNTVYEVQTVTVGPKNGAAYPSNPTTNYSNPVFVTAAMPSGDFYILPTNGPCGVDILANILTITNYTTNIITSATNSFPTTNSVLSSEQIQVFSSVSHIFTIYPITCTETPGATNIYPGLGKIQFVRADFDSLIGQYWQPVTNNYTRTVLNTNSQLAVQHFQRIATQPDFVLDANDFIGANTFNGTIERNINFDQSTVPAGYAGPGAIDSPTTITYNKVGDAFRNGPPAIYPTAPFLNQLTQYPTAAWASFDGTTNPPTVYPNGNSIQNLVSEILVQVSPTIVPDGTNNVAYPAVTFTASGGAFRPSFTWSATGLPPGMTVTTGTTVDPNGDGVLSGTPTSSGTYDFTLQLTDNLGRTVQWFYTIIIQ